MGIIECWEKEGLLHKEKVEIPNTIKYRKSRWSMGIDSEEFTAKLKFNLKSELEVVLFGPPESFYTFAPIAWKDQAHPSGRKADLLLLLMKGSLFNLERERIGTMGIIDLGKFSTKFDIYIPTQVLPLDNPYLYNLPEIILHRSVARSLKTYETKISWETFLKKHHNQLPENIEDAIRSALEDTTISGLSNPPPPKFKSEF